MQPMRSCTAWMILHLKHSPILLKKSRNKSHNLFVPKLGLPGEPPRHSRWVRLKNTRTQDESKRPQQHITSRSKRNSTKKDRKPNNTLYQQQRQPPLSKLHHLHSALCIQSQKYQWPKNTPQQNA